MHQDRLLGDAGRFKEVSARRGAAADVAPGRHARLSLRGGGRAEPVAPSGGSRPSLPGRREPAADRFCGNRQDSHGQEDRRGSEDGDTVHIITKTHAAVQNVGLGAQTADHWVRRNVRNGHCSATWLVIEELTQLDTFLWADVACLSMNKKIDSLPTARGLPPSWIASRGRRCARS